VFDGVGWGEIVVLLVLALFIFGPERLPKAAKDAGRMLRQLRSMATGMRENIRSELGPEFADVDLRTLHPKTFVRKHLFEDEDDPLFPPYRSPRATIDSLLADDPPAQRQPEPTVAATQASGPSLVKNSVHGPSSPVTGPTPFDADAT
jgi:sec-independent protein translocase protein TatB